MRVALAFVSGVVIEALYALGVLFIGERKGLVASSISLLWGISFIVGINESFASRVAAAAWCLGLAVGTFIGIKLKR